MMTCHQNLKYLSKTFSQVLEMHRERMGMLMEVMKVMEAIKDRK
jgi:hypothetical protein